MIVLYFGIQCSPTFKVEMFLFYLVFFECSDSCSCIKTKHLNPVSTNLTTNSKNPVCKNLVVWQKFAILVLINMRTCLAKQDQAGSYNYVGYS